MTKAIVLAGGKGRRLQSESTDLPKVLRLVKGKPLLGYVLEHIRFIQDIVLVVGFQKEKVMETFGSEFRYAVQTEQLGTGHATLCAEEYFENYDGNILVAYGDMPLLKEQTYKGAIARHEETGADCTIVTAVVDEKLTYGRIIRKDGRITDIVEEKDCSQEEKEIKELNIGIYVFKSRELFSRLKRIQNYNAQKEYYLTDVPKIFLEDRLMVESFTISDYREIIGVSTEDDLKLCERYI